MCALVSEDRLHLLSMYRRVCDGSWDQGRAGILT